ncbi:MAG: hypothetical protein KZQ92_19180 [Candidatus Thiodiazotropha sp. (ex Lucinoma borealis)]|nr:hypothetical protein [Candidatus Thiodiazotropha sp. (ex Lucinoma borealis)]
MPDQTDMRNLSFRHSGIEHTAIPAGIFSDPNLKATDRNVLCVMRTQIRQGSKMVMPTYKEIRRMANIGSDATVSRALSILRITRWIMKTQEIRDGAGRIIRIAYDLFDEPESLQRVMDDDPSFLEFLETSESHYHPAVANAARAANRGLQFFVADVADGKRSVRTLGLNEKQEIREMAQQHQAKIVRGEDTGDTHGHYIVSSSSITVLDEEESGLDTRLQFLKSQNSQTSKNEVLSSSSSFNITTTTEDAFSQKEPETLFWPAVLIDMLNENERQLLLRKLSTAPCQEQQPLINQLAGRMMDKSQPGLEDPVKYGLWLIKHHLAGEEVLTSFSTRDYRERNPGQSKAHQKQVLEKQIREMESKVQTIRTMLEHANSNPALRQQLEESLRREGIKLQELRQVRSECG